MPNSRYGSGSSRYYYRDSTVLINHYDIMDDNQLQRMETILSTQRLAELQAFPAQGDFDLRHLQKIHKYLFGDLYPFAGEIRTENITKDGFSFAQARFIKEAAGPLFEALAKEDWEHMDRGELAVYLAYYMAELNVLHPFREGNGRALREFIRCLALEANFDLDWSVLPRERILQASIESVHDPQILRRVIEESLSKKN
ncbi:cell filamentation protein Fic [Halobacillus halophilus]|uniref:protein adenylyltransferase n=1 Tax=Halobacillus halophilus (strain ATCC 35676 / DSM 2266 / JCM 20832 / KCTC 3685 / LMG 17431 / NBRC 102448 / NCIMB 2269) TaxID=866895 RepID=I0JSZ6_HALH3|nr:Fic family protein [Halobacillus halophilus]ASF41189.1 cell filamentation protein Fic [Halobacillus halophilus]CCG47268.1 Fic family protein [Halobacillus halophilus DSM 2266]